MQSSTGTIPISHRGEPPWEIATLFPEQGTWTEEEFLRLPNNRLVEFDDGMIEVLPVPTQIHQQIVRFIWLLLEGHIESRKLGGAVYPAGYKIKIPRRRFRDPDLMYMTATQELSGERNFTEHVTLAVEVVSEDDPDRDYVKKRDEYALAGLLEYWIIDPQRKHFTVLTLENGSYLEHGCFVAGQTATSKIFPDLRIPIDQVPGMA